MATQLDIIALETSFDLVAPRREELVDRFYRRLFEDAPATRALFAQVDMRAQKRALLGALVTLRRSLRDLSSIAPFLAVHRRMDPCLSDRRRDHDRRCGAVGRRCMTR